MVVGQGILDAIADEGMQEMTALSDDARRKHMHYVHVKTDCPAHVQPSSFTRRGFWEHMCKVYKRVYPEGANPTGSIARFGLVAQERHHNSTRVEEQELHNHCIMYTTTRHLWKKVAHCSLQDGFPGLCFFCWFCLVFGSMTP